MALVNKLAAGLVVAATLANAKTIWVDSIDLAFVPETITADVGDIIEFHFRPHNHSVVMGDFDNPCMPAKTGGFFSGFLPINEGEHPQAFQVTINDTNPLVFYCSQNFHSHCQNGMVGVVNPTNGTLLSKYKDGAASLVAAVSPPEVFGGVLVKPNVTVTSPSSSEIGPSRTSTAPSQISSTATGAGKTTKACAGWVFAAAIAALLLG